MSNSELTHLDARGRAKMVDVGDKEVTKREATARASIAMQPETFQLIQSVKPKKATCLRLHVSPVYRPQKNVQT